MKIRDSKAGYLLILRLNKNFPNFLMQVILKWAFEKSGVPYFQAPLNSFIIKFFFAKFEGRKISFKIGVVGW